MRSLAISLLLAVAATSAVADSIRVLVQSSPLAGSQYDAAGRVWPALKPGDRLELVREADNRHDRNAVRVDWRGQPLGYVPRAENHQAGNVTADWRLVREPRSSGRVE